MAMRNSVKFKPNHKITVLLLLLNTIQRQLFVKLMHGMIPDCVYPPLMIYDEMTHQKNTPQHLGFKLFAKKGSNFGCLT